jgi:hypothetical protein
MERLCQKPNCKITAISRGKYCERHRTNKKKVVDLVKEFDKLEIEKNNKIEEDRALRVEQQAEYEETMRLDRERLDEIELQKMIELSKNEFYKEQEKKLELDPKDVYYNIKIHFPDGVKIRQSFRKDCKIENIRELIDVYVYNNKMKIVNYNLVYNFPKYIFTKDDSYVSLESLNFPKNFIFFLCDLDA